MVFYTRDCSCVILLRVCVYNLYMCNTAACVRACMRACVYNLYMCNTAVCVLVLDCFAPSCRHSFTKSGKREVLDEDR